MFTLVFHFNRILFMRKFVTCLTIILVVLFTACSKTTPDIADNSSQKKYITSSVRDKFIGSWKRIITLQLPDFVFNSRDSINPGVINFTDSIRIKKLVNISKDTSGNTSYLDSLIIIYPKTPGNMTDMDTINVQITDSATYTYRPIFLDVRYNPSDSTYKNVMLDFDGQGKRNANFPSGLILESGNLLYKKNASIFIGFWNSYLTKYSNN